MTLFLAALIVGLIAEVAATFWVLHRQLAWLHDTLIPWINAINTKLGLPK